MHFLFCRGQLGTQFNPMDIRAAYMTIFKPPKIAYLLQKVKGKTVITVLVIMIKFSTETLLKDGI